MEVLHHLREVGLAIEFFQLFVAFKESVLDHGVEVLLVVILGVFFYELQDEVEDAEVVLVVFQFELANGLGELLLMFVVELGLEDFFLVLDLGLVHDVEELLLALLELLEVFESDHKLVGGLTDHLIEFLDFQSFVVGILEAEMLLLGEAKVVFDFLDPADGLTEEKEFAQDEQSLQSKELLLQDILGDVLTNVQVLMILLLVHLLILIVDLIAFLSVHLQVLGHVFQELENELEIVLVREVELVLVFGLQLIEIFLHEFFEVDTDPIGHTDDAGKEVVLGHEDGLELLLLLHRENLRMFFHFHVYFL